MVGWDPFGIGRALIFSIIDRHGIREFWDPSNFLNVLSKLAAFGHWTLAGYRGTNLLIQLAKTLSIRFTEPHVSRS